MTTKAAKQNTVELEGHEFEVVKQGLDIDQVSTFVQELISQRDELIKKSAELRQREEHVASLTKLAEKTVIEADNLSEGIKREGLEQARAKADSVMENVKGLLLGVYDHLFQELGSLKGQMETSKQTFENDLSQFIENIDIPTTKDKSISEQDISEKRPTTNKAPTSKGEANIKSLYDKYIKPQTLPGSESQIEKTEATENKSTTDDSQAASTSVQESEPDDSLETFLA